MYNKKIDARTSTKENIIYFIQDAKCVSRTFFNFGPTSKNVCKVEFVEVKYYIIQGVTVLCQYDV